MFGGLKRNIGIDLGTANTLVYISGKGIVLIEPSVVAINSKTNEIIAVGSAAKQMIGRTPGSITAIRPMKDGVIGDFETTSKMIRYFLDKSIKSRCIINRKPFMMVCVPSGVTEVEKRAVIDAAKAAGAREAYTIEEPLAAAIGANLPVLEATGSMIVDIGGGTTEVAIISLGGIVCSRSVRVAGDEMDNAIIQYIKNVYKLMIGERTAETLKHEIGSAIPPDVEEYIEIKGRDLVTGLPKIIKISSTEVSEALSATINNIINAIKLTLEKAPPELSSDVMDRGIVLAGGGALLRNFDKLISRETGIPVIIADNPLDCVAIGTGQSLQYKDLLYMQKKR